MQHQIVEVALAIPLPKQYDYLLPQDLKAKIGCRVIVSFRNKKLCGVITALKKQSDVPSGKLKPVLTLVDETPLLSPALWQLCLWASKYYHYPLGEVLMLAFPSLLREGKNVRLEYTTLWFAKSHAESLLSLKKKAPKQYQAYEIIASYHEGFNNKAEIKPNILKQLLEKGFIEKKDTLFLTQTLKIKSPHLLNEEQQKVFDTLIKGSCSFNCFLLAGITGSGKTEVYLRTIETILAQGKQALVLIPEISLTPQTIQRFRERFNEPLVALHSGLNQTERAQSWELARLGIARIVIGTRSAVFTPLPDLGIIIIDEEHDPSFKQQDGFRYSARDLSIKLAHQLNIPIILGSATPALETWYNAKQNRYQLLTLSTRAGEAREPEFRVIDLRNQYLEEGLSKPLIEAIQLRLKNHEQVLIFLNRRGYAPSLLCHQCGWQAGCKRCAARLTLHLSPKYLHCHHCDSRYPLMKRCLACNSDNVIALGLGTERLEEALSTHFPTTSMVRIDRDSTRKKGSLQEKLEGIQSGDSQILIGTQMLAKGHHFPNVTLVAIIDADSGFFSSDFRATERMGQLLLQVAGRAGRAEKRGQVFIQTHQPDHPLLQDLLKKGYFAFSDALLEERKNALLPPFSFLALLRAEAAKPEIAERFLKAVKALYPHPNVEVLGPIPAPMPKRDGNFRAQLLIQAKKRTLIQAYLEKLTPEIYNLKIQNQVRWSLDIDPIDML